MCEGSCQKWFHRYCAGVSASCYRALSSSSSPFICWVCSQELHRTVVGQLQAEIAALREEVLELRNNSDRNQSWTKVVSKRTQAAMGPLMKKSPSRERNPPARPSRPSPASRSESQRNDGKRARQSRHQVQVEGKRKIWGTWPTTTVAAVRNSIKAVTNVENLTIKRKYKISSRSGSNDESSARKTKWWFLVSGNEEYLKKLQEKWPAVRVQTGWSLEPVFCFEEGVSTQQAGESNTSNPILQPRNETIMLESSCNQPSDTDTAETTENHDDLESTQSSPNNATAPNSSQD